MPTDEELQAHCYSCHDFSNSQTILMKGRCPWKTLTELAYVVSLNDLKKNPKNQKQTKNPNQQNQSKTKPSWKPGLSFNSESVAYTPMLYISFSRDF